MTTLECGVCFYKGDVSEFYHLHSLIEEYQTQMDISCRSAKGVCPKCGSFAFEKDRLYFVMLSVAVLDGSSQEITDVVEETIAEFIVKASSDQDAIEMGEKVRCVYSNDDRNEVDILIKARLMDDVIQS